MSVCPNCKQPTFPDDIYCGSCGQAMQAMPQAPQVPVVQPVVGPAMPCPTCGHVNEPDAIYCEIDGTPLKTSGPIPGPGPVGGLGVLMLPDQTELTWSSPSRTIGRADLVRYVKQEQATEIGRAHLTITFENGAFFLQDGGPDPSNPQSWKPSLNKTYLNGEMLQPGEKRQLKTNDVVNAAGLVALTFKTR